MVSDCEGFITLIGQWKRYFLVNLSSFELEVIVGVLEKPNIRKNPICRVTF